jgi:hypothetical protein
MNRLRQVVLLQDPLKKPLSHCHLLINIHSLARFYKRRERERERDEATTLQKSCIRGSSGMGLGYGYDDSNFVCLPILCIF